MEEMMSTLAAPPTVASDKMASGMEVHTSILLDILETVTRIETKMSHQDPFDLETIYDDVFGDDRNSLNYIGGGGGSQLSESHVATIASPVAVAF